MLPRHRSRQSELASRPCIIALFVLLVFLLFVLFFIFAGGMLVATDDLPNHVDGFVVLQGSALGENARLAGAVSVLPKFSGSRILLSIPHETYWGQLVEPLASSFVRQEYGTRIADRTDFCETGPDVNSTEEEADALIPCIEQRGWRDIAVVTSNYHTRRAGIIWRSALRKRRSSVQLWIYGVNDPEFQASKWWRRRLSAKTTFFEFSKLVSVLIGRS